jgi:hypothetical protein
MFSFSTHPIHLSSKIDKHISFHDLVNLIKNSPIKEKYYPLYELRKLGNSEECRKYKQEKIPWVTPNAMVKRRKLSEREDFDLNFIQSSGYVYFDIDEDNGDLDQYKTSLIEKYGSVVSLISKSCSNRGISFLVKVNVLINSINEFERVYEYVRLNYFPDLKFDDVVNRLGSSWFIPFDNEVFVNNDSIIIIPNEILKGSCDVLLKNHPLNIHRVTPSNEKEKGTRKHNYIDLSIREVFEQCNLETPVFVEDYFSISPTPILQIRFPKVIKDGSKRKVFRKVIHDFLELNPDFTISHVYLFINHINENYAKPKMEPGLLKKVVESQFDLIKSQEDYVNKSKKTLRSIHYKNKGAVSRNKKIRFSSRFRGMMERYQTFQRIQYAMNFLYDEHGDYTYQQIADLLGLSLRTVKRRVKLKKEDFEREYLEFKEELEKVVNESNMDLLKIQGK